MGDIAVPPGADTVLVRVGEIGTKSERVRYQMQDTLGSSLHALLADREITAQIEHRRNRPMIRTSAVVAATRVATDAMGVVSASPAVSTEPSLAAIQEGLATLAADLYTGGTFGVRANRRGSLSFDSQDIGTVGGDAIWQAVESRFEPAVDLDDPDHTFYVDVDSEEAFLYLSKEVGPGGLPLGSQDPVVALISGGIDSPVAAYEVMRRGAPIIPVYFDLGTYGGPDHMARALDATAQLAAYDPERLDTLYVIPAGDYIDKLAASMERGRMVSLRRFMYRVASEVAAAHDAAGIVTGESIGQKSSQTMQNLQVTSAATTLPIHRPLLTREKQSIIEQAKSIGTYSAAEIDAGCNRIAPDQVMTAATHDSLAVVEPDELFEWAAAASADIESHPLAAWR